MDLRSGRGRQQLLQAGEQEERGAGRHSRGTAPISDSTVRAHLEHLRNKLGARSRAELTIAARESGLGCAPSTDDDDSTS